MTATKYTSGGRLSRFSSSRRSSPGRRLYATIQFSLARLLIEPDIHPYACCLYRPCYSVDIEQSFFASSRGLISCERSRDRFASQNSAHFEPAEVAIFKPRHRTAAPSETMPARAATRNAAEFESLDVSQRNSLETFAAVTNRDPTSRASLEALRDADWNLEVRTECEPASVLSKSGARGEGGFSPVWLLVQPTRTRAVGARRSDCDARADRHLAGVRWDTSVPSCIVTNARRGRRAGRPRRPERPATVARIPWLEEANPNGRTRNGSHRVVLSPAGESPPETASSHRNARQLTELPFRQTLAVPLAILAYPVALLYNFGAAIVVFLARLFRLRPSSTASFRPRNPFAGAARPRTTVSPAAAAENFVRSVERVTSLSRRASAAFGTASSSSVAAAAGPSSSSGPIRRHTGTSANRSGTGPRIPDFFIGSYDEALRFARDDMRILMIILTSEEHERDERLKREVLVSEVLNELIEEERIVVWGGDVSDRDAYQGKATVSRDAYPVL